VNARGEAHHRETPGRLGVPRVYRSVTTANDAKSVIDGP